MDIERLKELQIAKQVLILNKSAVEYDLVPSKDDQDFIDAVEIAVSLIDEAIARQSATGEDVAEAIKDLTTLSNVWQEIGQPTKELDLAITALQAYQPWVPVSERLPENYQNVLVARNFKDNPNNFILCSFASFVNGNWYEERKKRTTVTHWKPLPEPPKGE